MSPLTQELTRLLFVWLLALGQSLAGGGAAPDWRGKPSGTANLSEDDDPPLPLVSLLVVAGIIAHQVAHGGPELGHVELGISRLRWRRPADCHAPPVPCNSMKLPGCESSLWDPSAVLVLERCGDWFAVLIPTTAGWRKTRALIRVWVHRSSLSLVTNRWIPARRGKMWFEPGTRLKQAHGKRWLDVGLAIDNGKPPLTFASAYISAHPSGFIPPRIPPKAVGLTWRPLSVFRPKSAPHLGPLLTRVWPSLFPTSRCFRTQRRLRGTFVSHRTRNCRRWRGQEQAVLSACHATWAEGAPSGAGRGQQHRMAWLKTSDHGWLGACLAVDATLLHPLLNLMEPWLKRTDEDGPGALMRSCSGRLRRGHYTTWLLPATPLYQPGEGLFGVTVQALEIGPLLWREGSLACHLINTTWCGTTSWTERLLWPTTPNRDLPERVPRHGPNGRRVICFPSAFAVPYSCGPSSLGGACPRKSIGE